MALIKGAFSLKRNSECLITDYSRVTLGYYEPPLLKAEKRRTIPQITSLSQKRTEGGAPVRGSEFTTKAATLKGDSANFAARLNVKIRDMTCD